MARAVVELEGLERVFGPVVAAGGIALAVFEGEFLSLLGPSGCGKTTTLNLIAGFLEPTRGRIRIDGEDVTRVPPYRRGLGVVFQNYALFPHMTVFENIAFGLRMRRVPPREMERRVGEALALVRLQGSERAWPVQLSGGMQQRVALARALVIQPRVLLLDEPLAARDKKLREEMGGELREIQRAVRITTIFVTHDQEEALGLSDRVAVMHRGRIEQLGTPRAIYERPAARFVADFIGASNILPVRVVAARAGEAEVELEGTGRLMVRQAGGGTLASGARAELLIRPERLRLVPPGAEGLNILSARIVGLTYLGSRTEAQVELEGGRRLWVSLDEHGCPVTLAEGEAVRVALPPEAFLELGGEP
jgi:spermidine/putrescine ABC transporter ATP-binding subunit